MPTKPESHEMRAYAESFGSNAARYDRARPRYPEALVRRIADGSPGPDVLDVGCGTGIAARQFQAIGCRVLGVEPDPRMAGVARDLGVEVEVARFEEWEPAGRQFDAVVAGQSWHWIDPVAGAVRARQALRGAGRLAAFWHVFHFPEGVAEAFAEVFGRVVPDSPITITAMTKAAAGGYEAQLDRASDGFKEAGGFGEPERWQYDWEWTHTRDTWLDMMPTMGMLNSLPDEKVAEILDGVGAAVDALGGRFTLPYETVAVIATRTP